jgi:anti-sigma B factor antagonist
MLRAMAEDGAHTSTDASELAPRFEVSEEALEGGAGVVAVRGEIHVSTAPELSTVLADALARGVHSLVLDFTDVEFIDSTGLSVLLNALRRVTQRGGKFVIVCTNPTVLRLFEITRLESTFDIVATRDEALARVGST